MDFKHHILLGAAAEKARKEFDAANKRLSGTTGSFTSRMDGNSTGGLIFSIIGAVIWAAAFIVGGNALKNNVRLGDFGWFLVNATIVTALLLCLAFVIDAGINLSYYGRISSYIGRVSNMKRRVDSGLNSLGKNHEAFMKSKDKGWNYRLSPGTSIPEEVQSLEQKMASMESLSQNFLNGAKNVLFFALAGLFALTSCLVLFETAEQIADNLNSDNMNGNIMEVINYISMAIVVAGEIILAKLAWSGNCKVTFGCLFVILAAPVAFALLDAVIALIVVLVIILIPVLVAIAVLAFICCCSSGD